MHWAFTYFSYWYHWSTLYSYFSSLVGIPIRITSFALGLRICVITAGIIMNTSIINKKKRKHDKTVLLAKDKFNSAKILIFKALIESYITHDELASVNNMLREYDDMKDTVKTSIQLRPQRFIENLKLYISHCNHIIWSVEERQKVKSVGLKDEKRKQILLSKRPLRYIKKSKFIKKQDPGGVFSN